MADAQEPGVIALLEEVLTRAVNATATAITPAAGLNSHATAFGDNN